MTTHSFADISSHNWSPSTIYQAIQTAIQEEVTQGLWENDIHIDVWCNIAVSEVQGVGNSWVTHTYQNKNDNSTTTVLWPASWPAPAENKHGQLPGHFFIRQAKSGANKTPGIVAVLVLSETEVAPATQPTYKASGACV